MNKFKVGDKVMLREDSKWVGRGSCNPTNVIGVITEVYEYYSEEYFKYRVKWSETSYNVYSANDLDLVEDIKQEKETMKKKNMIGKSGTDWSKAPDDATHFCPDGAIAKWYKKDGDNLLYFSIDHTNWEISCNGQWYIDRYISKEDDLNIKEDLISVVDESTFTDYKIRHFRVNQHESKGGAVTLLYRKIPQGYEYKFSVCSPNDNFDRKVGVDVAYSKPASKIYNLTFKEDLFRGILANAVFSRPLGRNENIVLSKIMLSLIQ